MKRIYLAGIIFSLLALVVFMVLSGMQMNGNHPYEALWITLSMVFFLLLFVFLGLFMKERGKERKK